jgi:hypothetical protein
MKINGLLVALFAAGILTIGLGMSASDYSSQYINAINGNPGWIDIYPNSYQLDWQLYEGSNVYDSYPSMGPEDWFVSSNKDWHADIYDSSGHDGHLYDGNTGNYLRNQMQIYPYTYGVNTINLSNGYQTLWAGPAGNNLWLDNAYSYTVDTGEPEGYYGLTLGAYAYTDY